MSARHERVRLVRARLVRSPGSDGGDVHVTADGQHDTLSLALTRVHVTDDPSPSCPMLDEHLAVHLADGDATGWASIADVLLYDGAWRPPTGFYGVVACALEPDGRCAITVKDEPGTTLVASLDDAVWVASFVHAWRVSGRRAAALLSMRITVRRVPTAVP
ncbi:hypothetical protein E1264_19345 [Actinomadura sp. KC216]|uniref:hypothetical protein n=1 Tax=Actinomadura sp. KC216 TaxID=2530370 RepID=UPI00104B22EF|nr:hypothetical protein [Actinomadura sp. KC216]TDB85989.1 hypothetical protein E1264_19345 [Actinomadura sp. KC216]